MSDFGTIPFGSPAGQLPWALQDFEVHVGIEGPQVVCSWSPPARSISHLCIVRKAGEYPRDVNDGVLVYEAVDGLDEAGSAVDVGEDLVLEGSTSRWWYYRAFVKPAPIPANERFNGAGHQELTPDGSLFIDWGGELPQEVPYAASEMIDMQEFSEFSLRVEHSIGVGPLLVRVYSAPTFFGPAVLIYEDVGPEPDAVMSYSFTETSFKYIFCHVIGFFERALLWTLAPWAPSWMTTQSMSKPCLVFGTGYHEAAVLQTMVPNVWLALDQVRQRLLQAELSDGELVSFGVDAPQDLGLLMRWLKTVMPELDRVRAYAEDVREHHSSEDERPEGVLDAVAYELGLSLNKDAPLNEMRADIAGAPGLWKSKGRGWLFLQLCKQVLGFVPRVQEGPGLVARTTDPDSFPRG